MTITPMTANQKTMRTGGSVAEIRRNETIAIAARAPEASPIAALAVWPSERTGPSTSSTPTSPSGTVKASQPGGRSRFSHQPSSGMNSGLVLLSNSAVDSFRWVVAWNRQTIADSPKAPRQTWPQGLAVAQPARPVRHAQGARSTSDTRFRQKTIRFSGAPKPCAVRASAPMPANASAAVNAWRLARARLSAGAGDEDTEHRLAPKGAQCTPSPWRWR